MSRSFCCLIRVSSSSRRRNSTAVNSLAALSKGVSARLRRARKRGRSGETADCGVAGDLNRGRRLADGEIADARGAGGRLRLGVVGVAGAGGDCPAEAGVAGGDGAAGCRL